jgi:beta-phosphoglucomutase-like phosphatase (HAD superfamily)
MTTTSTLAAALWDFDGTLANTEPLWVEAEFDLIGALGGSWSVAHADQLVGNSLIDSGSYILNTIGRHDLSPAWVVDELIDRVVEAIRSRPVPWQPGALDLLDSFAAAGVPCALVSASYRVLLDAALQQLPRDAFQAVLGNEVRHGKPHPELPRRPRRPAGRQPTLRLRDSITGAGRAMRLSPGHGTSGHYPARAPAQHVSRWPSSTPRK